MANGRFLIGKPSGGVTTVTSVDGVGNTNLVLPESGTIATTADVNSGTVLLKTIATGTATFTATTNNINLTGIGIGVEVGDVIQISGAIDAKNNSEFTVEVITDANNIIVNQAHANKGTTKNVAAQAGDAGVTVKLLAKWYNAPIGLGQDWVDVSSLRVFGTTYTNNTNRTIGLALESIATANTNVGVAINGSIPIEQQITAAGYYGSVCTNVSKGSTFVYLRANTSQSTNRFYELR